MKVHRLHSDILIMQRNENRKAEKPIKKPKKVNKKSAETKEDEIQEVKAEEEV